MPTDSSYPPIDIPDVDVFTYLFQYKNKPIHFPDTQPIYIDGNTKRTLTYADVRDQATAFGIGIRSLWGWKKSDVLCVFSTNQIDTPPIMWGTMHAGGTVTPANPSYTVEELAYQLADAGAKAIATIIDLLPTVTQAAEKVGIPKDRIVVIGDKRSREFRHWREIIDPSTSVKWRRVKLNPSKDLAFLSYSSGTTGHPKGVMLSHRNIVANMLQCLAGEGDNLSWEKDRLMAFLPFYHIYGLTLIVHQACLAGRTAIVMDRFELAKFCQLIQDHKITYVYLVPPVILLLTKNPIVDKYDLSSIRMINSGAAPLTRELTEAIYKRLKVPIKQGYGLTETSPTTHTTKWHEWDKAIGSVGDLLPNLTAKYMSEDEKELPVGETGELWMKGPNIMLGYLNKPEATKNALTEDGYFKTGDVGYQDKNGKFWITDRMKELIKYKGFQVPPAELEGLLLGHDKIDDCAVIGVYDENLASEVPVAYIVARQGVEKDQALKEELIKYVHDRVAQHKRLRGGVKFIEAIPKSPSGKILRRVLRLQAAEELKALRNPKAKL